MPQPMVDTPENALQRLRGMLTGSNVSTLSNRGLDIAQGLSDYEPSDVELQEAQNELGGRYSREQLREGAMSRIKRQLSDAATAQSYKMQQSQLEANRDLAKQRLANEGTSSVARIQTEGKAAQAEAAANAKQAALDALLGAAGGTGRALSVSGVGSIGAERAPVAQSRMSQPTDAQMKRLNSSRSNFEGFSPFSRAYEWFTGKPSGERTAYGAELEGILQRAGSMQDMNELVGRLAQYPGSVDEKLAAEQASQDENSFDVTALSPYEREYIRFKLGQ